MMQILVHTPIWVFILFLVLLIFGFLQTRNREVKYRAAFILPFGMVLLSLTGVASSFGLGALPIGLWVLGLLTFSFISYKIFPLKGVNFNALKSVYVIPGSWLSFVVIMLIFFTKYVVAVMKATGVPLANDPTFAHVLCFSYGCFSGFFISRVISLVYAKRLDSNGEINVAS